MVDFSRAGRVKEDNFVDPDHSTVRALFQRGDSGKCGEGRSSFIVTSE